MPPFCNGLLLQLGVATTDQRLLLQLQPLHPDFELQQQPQHGRLCNGHDATVRTTMKVNPRVIYYEAIEGQNGALLW